MDFKIVRYISVGFLSILGLLAFYIGIMTWANGIEHAVNQLKEDGFLVSLIMLGFGTQMGLYKYLKDLNARNTSANVVSVGGTGTSSAAMLACCAHHLIDIVPIIGLSSTLLFLENFKTPMMIFGIIMNLIGILYIIRKIVNIRKLLLKAV